MKKLMAIVVSALFAAVGAQAKTTDVTPADDLVAIAAAAESGDVIQLAAGTYELAQQIALSGKSDITFTGAGKDKTVIVVQNGVSSRHVSLSGMTNVKFEGISFRNAKLEYDAADATSTQGGSFRVENTVNLQIEGCSFVSNTLQNTLTANPAVNLQGGALYVLDSDIHFLNCDFEKNGVLWSAGNSGDKNCYGGVLSMSTPTGASDSELRINLTATNCVFRNNFMSIMPNGTESRAYGGILRLESSGADFFNCLMTGTHATYQTTGSGTKLSKKNTTIRQMVYVNGVGCTHRYTQCTLANNAGKTFFSGIENTGSSPILIRSVVCGHWFDLDATKTTSSMAVRQYNPQAVLIDSVYSSGSQPAASRSLFGETFKSSNYVKSDSTSLLEREGELKPGVITAAGVVGWHPVGGRTYNDWYVSAAAGASDENTGTEDSPFRTLAKAISVCGHGDTITLAAGSYTQGSGEVFPYDLTDKYNVTIKGAGRDATVIDGEGDTTYKSVFRLVRSHSLRISDLTITGMDPKSSEADDMPVIFSMTECAHPVFANVSISNNKLNPNTANYIPTLTGMTTLTCSAPVCFEECLLTNNLHYVTSKGTKVVGWLFNSAYCYLKYDACQISGNGWVPASSTRKGEDEAPILYADGMNVTHSGSVEMKNCLISDNGSKINPSYGSVAVTAYLSVYTSDAVTFDNCTVANNTNGTFLSVSKTSTTNPSGLHNCLISHSGTVLGTTTSTSFYAYDSLFSNTLENDPSLAKFTNKDTFDANGVKLGVDPKFKDAANGDYHLTGESTLAIDKGATLDWMSDASVDLDGNPRLVGYWHRKKIIPDIGCYELPWKAPGLTLIIR